MTLAVVVALLLSRRRWKTVRSRVRARLPLNWPGRRRRKPATGDRLEEYVAELVGLGLSAGLTFPSALERAADELDPTAGGEVRRLSRRLRSGGIAAVLEAHEGSLQRLALLVGRAQSTGAPLLPALEALLDGLLEERRSAQLAAARRLPVKLAVPLALLILPGFVLLITGPALLATLERIGI